METINNPKIEAANLLAEKASFLNKQKSSLLKIATKSFNRLMAILLLMAIGSTTSFANNLAISNVSLSNQNTTSHSILVNFDISWDNSWRIGVGPSNYDAAWVFVKYRIKNGSVWHHATLHYVDGTGTGDGHTVPAGATIASANDNGSNGAHGVFTYHSTMMTLGSVNYTGVKLRWDYGVDGLNDADLIEVCVFGMEMVYVPQAAFELGSGGGGTETDYFYEGSTANDTYTVNSEGAITVGSSSGNLYYDNLNLNSGDQSGPIPAAFPKGYDAFYCMKYEITQEQYTEFLNKLSYTQDGNRFPNHNGDDRHAITGSFGSRTTSKPYVACNYLSWADLTAYLDWAALRPMTELEYEKACRGGQTPVANGYAWGSTNITKATGISNDGANNETASNAGANCIGNSVTGGPMRVGCLGQGVNTRESTGGSYYGIMELTGNIIEHLVTVGHSTGRAFTGANGDGTLNYSGDANTPNWPGTDAIGSGFRGGAWNGGFLWTSDRNNAADNNSSRSDNYGGRGVRLAP